MSALSAHLFGKGPKKVDLDFSKKIYTCGDVLPTTYTAPSYCPWGFAIGRDELKLGPHGMSDKKSPQKVEFFKLLEVIRGCRDSQPHSHDADPVKMEAYFIETDIGFFYIGNIPTRGDFALFSTLMYDSFARQPCPSRALLPDAKSIAHAINAGLSISIPRDRSPQDASLPDTAEYEFSNIRRYQLELDAAGGPPCIVPSTIPHYGAEETGHGGKMVRNVIEGGPELPCEVGGHRYLLNPFLAMHVSRIFTEDLIRDMIVRSGKFPPEEVEAEVEKYRWLCYGTDESIFRPDGTLNLDTVPEGECVFRISADDLNGNRNFPTVLPPHVQLVTMLKESQPHLEHAIPKFEPNVLHCKVLVEDPVLTPAEFESLSDDDKRIFEPLVFPVPMRFVNPLRYNPNLAEVTTYVDCPMTYIQDAKALIANYYDAHLDIPQTEKMQRRRMHIATQYANVIRAMASSPEQTPGAVEDVANALAKGLTENGLHWLQPEDRPCKEGAHHIYLVNGFTACGASDTQVTIGLRGAYFGMTNYVTKNGSASMVVCGLPGTCKTYTYEKILMPIFPGMMSINGWSDHAFSDYDTMRMYHRRPIFKDEIGDNDLKNPDMIKLMTGGASASVRARNTIGQDVKKAHTATPCVTLLTATNKEPTFFFKAEAGNYKGASALLDRFQGVYFLGHKDDIIDEVLQPMFLSRFKRALPEATQSELRTYMAMVQMACLLTSEGLIAEPDTPEFGAIVRDLSKEFSKTTVQDLTNKGTRRGLALRNLALVAFWFERIFEEAVMGGIPSTGSLLDYALILYDISVSAVLSYENIVWAFSLIADSILGAQEGSVMAASILEYSDKGAFDWGTNAAIIDEVAIGSLRQQLGLESEEALYKQMTDLRSLTVTGTDANGNACKEPAVAYGKQHGTKKLPKLHVSKYFLKMAVRRGGSDFDRMFFLALDNLYRATTSNQRQELLDIGELYSGEIINYDPNEIKKTGRLTEPIVVNFRDLFCYLVYAYTHEAKTNPNISRSPSNLLTMVQKRLFLDCIVASDQAALWDLDENAVRVEEGVTEGYRTMTGKLAELTLRIQPDYANKFVKYSRKTGDIASMVLNTSLKDGVLPICVPSQANVCIPDFVEIGKDDVGVKERAKKPRKVAYPDLRRSNSIVPEFVTTALKSGRRSYDDELIKRLAENRIFARDPQDPRTADFPTSSALYIKYATHHRDKRNKTKEDLISFSELKINAPEDRAEVDHSTMIDIYCKNIRDEYLGGPPPPLPFSGHVLGGGLGGGLGGSVHGHGAIYSGGSTGGQEGDEQGSNDEAGWDGAGPGPAASPPRGSPARMQPGSRQSRAGGSASPPPSGPVRSAVSPKRHMDDDPQEDDAEGMQWSP
jgi:hypothetical protein